VLESRIIKGTDTHHPVFYLYRPKGSHLYRGSSTEKLGAGLAKRRILVEEGTDIDSKALDHRRGFGRRDLFDCDWSLCCVGCAKHPGRGSAGAWRSTHSHAEAHAASDAYALIDYDCHPYADTYVHSKPNYAGSTGQPDGVVTGNPGYRGCSPANPGADSYAISYAHPGAAHADPKATDADAQTPVAGL
jgi:hypothetical protein